ncbi:cyclic nucleotide-binding domain-containing protein 1 isoform X4 [Equus przewalskii]|uniref:Cyclic nucleotide-binding domain-containing protein 1 isoform X4 n=1 Tax=Equus przewalskii TaxID=9798 RepID=A0ABM4QAI9_EQUPR
MPLSSVPAAILAHMMAIENVPPPPLRSLPSLKMSRHIDYGQLNALCQTRGLQYKKPTEGTEESQAQQPAEDSHNVAVYIKKARGGHTLYGPKKSEENFVEFLAILKKLPVHRTPSEHNTVWRTLRTIPNLTSQLSDEHLKILIIANDGFYIILKGLARPQTRVYKSLVEENESKASFIAQNYHSFVFDEDFKNSLLAGLRIPSCDSMLGQWSTFGTLEVIAQTESIAKYAVVMEEDCEILRIPAKDCTKLKLEEKKLENKQKVKLIRQCPYYEEWPTLSIYELVGLIKWKKFPPGHVIVESGSIISFVAYINSGYCNVYRSIVGLVKLQSKRAKKVRKLVYMGQLKEEASFGEISVLLQLPFTCTIVTGKEVEMAIIEDKDIFELDPVTKQLMLQTAQPTFGHLTDEDVKNEYLQEEKQKEWENFKDKTIKESLYYGGIIPGFGKWSHQWTSIPRNLKDTLISY